MKEQCVDYCQSGQGKSKGRNSPSDSSTGNPEHYNGEVGAIEHIPTDINFESLLCPDVPVVDPLLKRMSSIGKCQDP